MFDANKLTADVVSRVMNHMEWKFMNQLWFAPPHLMSVAANQPHPLKQSPLRDQITTLCNVANGEFPRHEAHPAFVGEVMEMTQSLVETLYSTPLDNTYQVPAHFWQTELGQVIVLAQLWAREDELITLREAALILRGDDSNTSLVWINAQIANGSLTRYADPGEKNPQKAGRVSRQEVEALKNA